jgi:hypothetical protein
MDKFTKRGSDGSVDVAASANAYAKALTEWAAQNEIPTETIEAAVEAVFDANPGRVGMPALTSMAATSISSDPGAFNTLRLRVHAYVTGQSAGNTGRLDIAKGKGGGVLRLSLPGEPVPARQAKKSA